MNLMVRLRQHPNGVWYVHYSRTNRKSLQTKDKALAERPGTLYQRDYRRVCRK